MVNTYRFIALIYIAGWLITGCAGSQGPSLPTVPDAGIQPSVEAPVLTGQTETEDTAGESGHYLWAYHEIYIDPATLEFEIIPSRMTTGHWNVLRWLEDGPCFDCFSLVGLAPTGNGTLNAEIEISHPFAATNLTGFDVRGIAMFNGSHEFTESGLIASNRDLGDGCVVNPDGYTTLYNWTTEGSGPGGLQGYIKGNLGTVSYPNATLNPFKTFNSDNPANTRNAFYAGDSITAVYEVAMPSTGFIFGYAVDASWAPPTTKPVTNPMTQFPPEANCPEPWKIEITEFHIDQGLTDEGGSTDLVIDVYDHQGKDSHLLPQVECADLFPGTIEAAWTSDSDGYSSFTATIENPVPAPVGEYLALVSIEDKDNASSTDWLDLTAYSIVTLEVTEYVFQNQLPVAIAEADPLTQTVCEIISFSDGGSYDPDGGDIQLYEWDWDNDGTYDETGADVVHAWDEPGTFHVQFRVTDDEDTTGTLDQPIEIDIVNALPTASAEVDDHYGIIGTEFEFDGTASTDNDCSGELIALYEWDFDFDGTFSQDNTGDIVTYAWAEAGTFAVQLRVTDDEGGTDLLDTPIEIHIVVDYMDPVPYATADPVPQTVCDPVNFSDDGSYDPDGGLIELYEWDWDNNGTFDEQGSELSHSWDEVGTFEIQFRVTDDDGASATLDEPIEIIIQNALPTASAEASKYAARPDEIVNFDASASTDNDCSGNEIVLYEWDWDFDGVFATDDTGVTSSHSWPLEDTYQVQLRVTDDEGATDLLDIPLTIVVDNLPPEISITNCPSQDINQASYTFAWTASDDSDDSSNLDYNVALDSAWQGWQTGILDYLWNPITSGPHEFTVQVRDNGTPQLTDEDSCSFNVNLAPEITITNCPSQDVNANSYTFEWSVSDDLDAPSALSYNVSRDGAWQGWQLGLSNYQWNSLSSGPHTFKIKVRDTGNPALESPESSCSFDVNFKPSVSIDNCPGSLVYVDNYTFNWTGSDDLSGESSMDYSWKLDAGSWSIWQTGLLTVGLTDLTDDTHTFSIRVRDTGNPQLTCETAPATCDSCAFEVDTSIIFPPGNVTGFSATDGKASLDVREVELTWNSVGGTVDYYDIEKSHWNDTLGWHWIPVDSVNGTQTYYLDTDARYSGTADPIDYRIKARNLGGSSPAWAQDTGYPRLRNIEMALWCVADDSSGSNPATTWTRGLADFNDCNSFWNQYGINYVLTNSGNFFWVTTAAYRHLSGGEPDLMHGDYGYLQTPDSMNCYYAESAYGSYSFAFARVWCPGSQNTLENVFIVMSRDTRGTEPDANPVCLAHECGHAITRFIDIYLLDSNHNLIHDDGTTCDDIQDFCTDYPTLWPPLFCDVDAFYPEEPNSFYKTPKQLMYYSFQGRPISDYDIYVSQYFWLDEWISDYESNYPEP